MFFPLKVSRNMVLYYAWLVCRFDGLKIAFQCISTKPYTVQQSSDRSIESALVALKLTRHQRLADGFYYPYTFLFTAC